jgi:hypothetical protein
VDFLIVSAIVVFVFMVIVVHHAYMEKMPKKLMAVAVVVHAVYGFYWQNVVYVV